ncbi:YjbE family putative metal transport protein [Rhodoplanes sp. Z2-YC6860]|uniref:YjbE family putative metal transport protein n=1 Tax=Rhodoplanes sp. Z2-YC6860 TaxID=674703 RepID=UPI00078DB90A|nr:YjbE family putative metal transport protein [Rhodoplanes sp. Z2-YC6860]AMN40232.1 integral membrane protein TerC [Rhodoplanes sp. Z2-YC6860]
MDLTQQLIALSQIIIIDFVLAGDNAIVVGMAASRVHPSIRAKVILLGVGGAVVLRILFAAIATQLLTIVGLTLAGGILLLWVCWKMYREIAIAAPAPAFAGHGGASGTSPIPQLTFGAALIQIIVADVSMSLDNVLAVAGAAKGEIWVLAVGLTVAVGFMALLSAYIAKLLARYHWITWIGLAIVLYVALEMIWNGSYQVGCQFVPKATCDGGALLTFRSLLS